MHKKSGLHLETGSVFCWVFRAASGLFAGFLCDSGLRRERNGLNRLCLTGCFVVASEGGQLADIHIVSHLTAVVLSTVADVGSLFLAFRRYHSVAADGDVFGLAGPE